MKLLIHLEDIEKLKKEGFKRKDAEQDFSGSQGKTTKWTKEYKSGAKETVFNKQNDDWIFSSITALSALLACTVCLIRGTSRLPLYPVLLPAVKTRC